MLKIFTNYSKFIWNLHFQKKNRKNFNPENLAPRFGHRKIFFKLSIFCIFIKKQSLKFLFIFFDFSVFWSMSKILIFAIFYFLDVKTGSFCFCIEFWILFEIQFSRSDLVFTLPVLKKIFESIYSMLVLDFDFRVWPNSRNANFYVRPKI